MAGVEDIDPGGDVVLVCGQGEDQYVGCSTAEFAGRASLISSKTEVPSIGCGHDASERRLQSSSFAEFLGGLKAERQRHSRNLTA